jgi:phosphate transport system substrate-binding protein
MLLKKLFCAGFLAMMAAAGSPASGADNELLGAGASFPYPLYSKMFDAYHKENKIKINYQSIGSGGGIRQLTAKAVDFGASDAFLSDEEIEKMPAPVVHIPTCLGAVAVTYNLPGSPEMKMDRKALSDIFLGKISKWNDPAVQALNPGVKLPEMDIVVVHRSDGSGTTNIFTNYLAKISPQWKESVGEGKSVNWPTGLGAKGNEGVSGLVKQVPGSIGYCELAYIIQNGMAQASLQNKSGNFIKPSLESASLAGEGNIPVDTRIMITDTDAKNGYPISGFTWILVYKEQNYDGRSKEKAETLVKMLKWMINDGQKYAAPLDYSPLPAAARKKVETILGSVNFEGKPILK